MKQAYLSPEDRPVVGAALSREEATGHPAAAIELPDGSLVTGKTTDLLGAAAAVLLNSLKELAGIYDKAESKAQNTGKSLKFDKTFK